MSYKRFLDAKRRESMFHWRDNTFFGRLPDGAVRIIKFDAPPFQDDLTDTGEVRSYIRPEGRYHSVNIVLDVTIPASEWASIVASVSACGEENGRHSLAMKFHQEE